MPVPSRSQIHNWETEQLRDCAGFWNRVAESWEVAFEQVHRLIGSPGGTPWTGRGAAAAQERARTDRLRVNDCIKGLRLAAAYADNAASELELAKRQALIAIGEAESQGFTVSEDLSVHDTQRTGWFPAEAFARQAQAESFAVDIRTRAAALAALDTERAADITSASVTLGDLVFGESTATDHVVQAVDWKQSPAEDLDGTSPGGSQPARGLPPEGVQPPTPGDLVPGPASRPSEAGKGGQSLWDENGGEWRYFPGDRYHNPHWDFNPHNAPNAPWDNVPIGDLPPVKDNQIITGLPPWLENPAAPGIVGPPLNPLLDPFPSTDMPAPTTLPGATPSLSLPRIDIPAPTPEDMANAGATGTGIVAGGGLLAMLYMLLVQN